MTTPPDDPDALYAEALAYAAIGRRGLVVQRLFRALRNGPEALADRARAEAAFAPYAEDRFLVEWLAPDSPVNDAVQELVDGEVDATVDLLRGYLAKQPDNAAAWYVLSCALLQREEHDEALVAADRALAADPAHADAAFNRAWVLANAGRDAEAEAAYRRALVSEPEHENVAVNLSLLLRAQGRHADALAVTAGVLAEAPAAGLVRYTHAESLALLDRPDEALAALRIVAEQDPEARAAVAQSDVFAPYTEQPEWRRFLRE